MFDLAINAEHKPRDQGAFILKRVETLRTALENARNNDARGLEDAEGATDPFDLDASGLVFEGMDSWFTDENFFGMEPIWHFPRVIPDA